MRESLMVIWTRRHGENRTGKRGYCRFLQDLAARCLYLQSVKDLQDLLRQLIQALYELKDPNLRQQLHAEGISV